MTVNFDPIPDPRRTAYFAARGIKPQGSEVRSEVRNIETTAGEMRAAVHPTRAAYFAAKAALKPANRFAARDAADRKRLEAKRTSPVFVTERMLRDWDARR